MAERKPHESADDLMDTVDGDDSDHIHYSTNDGESESAESTDDSPERLGVTGEGEEEAPESDDQEVEEQQIPEEQQLPEEQSEEQPEGQPEEQLPEEQQQPEEQAGSDDVEPLEDPEEAQRILKMVPQMDRQMLEHVAKKIWGLDFAFDEEWADDTYVRADVEGALMDIIEAGGHQAEEMSDEEEDDLDNYQDDPDEGPMGFEEHEVPGGLPPDEEGEEIEGGMAEGKDASEFDPESMKEGMDVEKEHADDPQVQQEISKDHLEEDPEYYEKLKKIES